MDARLGVTGSGESDDGEGVSGVPVSFREVREHLFPAVIAAGAEIPESDCAILILSIREFELDDPQ